MRLQISGTASQGKSTFLNDFLQEWPEYKTPNKTYRDLLNGKHSKKTDKDIQWRILNCMVDEIITHGEGDKVIYDRGPIDNIAYTVWCNSKGVGEVDDAFVEKCLPLLRETNKFLDIIFYIPITGVATVEHDTEKFGESVKEGLTDDEHREEIDHIFKALKYDWSNNAKSKFYDPDDKPAIIEVFGQPRERIEICKLYLDVDGDLIDNVGIMTEEQIREVEEMKGKLGISDDQSQAFRNPNTYE
tara:strand:+ start:5381 stop:6112 length:732 start_codon:yes stop_codon:yes gene_type:complete